MAQETNQLFENKIRVWASNRPDVRAVLVFGSQARTDYPADELADLDLLLLVIDPQRYFDGLDGVDDIGPQWLVAPNHHLDRGHAEWLVLFGGGYKIDFYFAPIAEAAFTVDALAQLPFQSVLQRGLRVLLDKTDTGPGASASIDHPARVYSQGQTSASAALWPPTPEQFTTVVDRILLSASRALKFIRRQDLWRAKFQCDVDLKRHLLTLIEWQAQASHGPAHDTWYDGRFLTDWADPQVLKALPDSFGTYDARDLLRALQATLELFDWVARDTAGRLNYHFPQPNHEAVAAWLAAQIEAVRLELKEEP